MAPPRYPVSRTAPRTEVRGITYRRRLPSCRYASSGKALVCQPIRANSPTYHGFRVSFQVALIPTTKTGHNERTRPAQTIQLLYAGFVSSAGTATELI